MVYLRAGNKERADHYSRIYQRYTELLSRRDALLSAREKEPGEARHYHELAKLYLEAGQPDTALGWLRVGKSLSRRRVDPVRERLAARAEELRRKGGDGPLLPGGMHLDCDHLFFALSQRPADDLGAQLGCERDEDGQIVAD